MGQDEVYEYLIKYSSKERKIDSVEISRALNIERSSISTNLRKLRGSKFVKFEALPPHKFVYWIEIEIEQNTQGEKQNETR